MALWCRIKQSQGKSLSNHFKRCYFQIHGPCSVNHNAFRITRIPAVKNPGWIFHKSQFEFVNSARSFAAPVQVKPKQEEDDGPRLNEKITAPYVRLVTDDGHGVLSRREALEHARRHKLDLVEVQKDGKPPVCKLMDYHKEMYQRHVKEKELKKSKSELIKRKGACKEVRIAGKIEKNDLQMKADTVKRLMERGYRVKCMAMGNEDQDLGGLLSRLSTLIEDVSVVESRPMVEKKQAYVVVRHVKFGPPKKGPGKKKAVAAPTTNASSQSHSQLESNLDEEGSTSQSEEDILSEEAPDSDDELEKNKSAWSVIDTNNDFNKAFEFKNDVNEIRGSNKTAPNTSPAPSNAIPKAPFGTENRYNRSGAENRYAPTRQMNVASPDGRIPTRFEPQFQNPGRQRQFDLNIHPPSREPGGFDTQASTFRNSETPANEFPAQETSRPTAPRSSTPSFGMFSTPKADDPQGPNGPAVVNRYMKGPNPSPPSSHNQGNRYGDQGAQGRRGVFRSENSNMNPRSTTENQDNFQR